MDQYWHFLRTDRKLGYGDGRTVEVGGIYPIPHSFKRPLICNYGMHGSERLIDALDNAPGPILCKVEIWGDVVSSMDKVAGRHRKVIAMLDATDTLIEFARKTALRYSRAFDIRCPRHYVQREAAYMARTSIAVTLKDMDWGDKRRATIMFDLNKQLEQMVNESSNWETV